MEVIDTFYVLDYDRCLGNVDASFSQLKKVVHDLSFINENSFQIARDTAESKGISFSALEYIRSFDSSIDISKVISLFTEYSNGSSNSLLETGASDLLNFLELKGKYFCIISYGENQWQLLKIKASGLSYIPHIIIPDSYKCVYISKWKNKKNQLFKVPKRCFSDNISRYAKEIVLIDDKLNAFDGILSGIRGYFVDSSSPSLIELKKIPISIKRITQISQVIEEELLK